MLNKGLDMIHGNPRSRLSDQGNEGLGMIHGNSGVEIQRPGLKKVLAQQSRGDLVVMCDDNLVGVMMGRDMCGGGFLMEIKPPSAGRFTHILSVGIGGSALGPQFVAEALAPDNPPLKIRFIDNTDPAGIDHQIAQLGAELASTLVIVVSKSGGTPETRNGLLEVQKAFREAGLDFSKQVLTSDLVLIVRKFWTSYSSNAVMDLTAKHLLEYKTEYNASSFFPKCGKCDMLLLPIIMQGVAITQENSLLDNTARIEGWLARFPMFDWVGGRTSEMSAVGLLAAALQGIDIKEMLAGAALMDDANRNNVVRNNPAALLALCWYWASDGVGSKDMVVLPYKDSLLLFSRYLQQLVMESLGKEFDLDGNRVKDIQTIPECLVVVFQHSHLEQKFSVIENVSDIVLVYPYCSNRPR
ncbi:hypothetical protein RJ639_023639 [Escallonia herrerae]|uniref:Glucose-6-phosphate isomerase n=1 Tax=Escallonia herrerae TaxID=1293975 RepID=A0AA88UZP8_9ASTE|nr:hypothetical protein RJ639_023639 [Escallonia herrerae]